MAGLARNKTPVPQAVLERLKACVGPGGFFETPAEMDPYVVSWRDDWRGRVPLVLRPKATEEVSEIVKICAGTRIPIVPQGGRTGLTGASQPHADGSEVIVSTDRLNRIRDIDPLNDTMTVEAGAVLANIQKAAAQAGRLFPLTLGAEGSCQIGGNLATNAGGTQVLRYGNARSLVLGLEVVLADGSIWDGLRGLRKDNTGYDLKHLFIGSEGTLGIITAAVLKLFPQQSDQQTALVAVADPEAGVKLLAAMRVRFGEIVTAFELIRRVCIETVIKMAKGHQDPFERPYPWYVLMDVSGPGEPGALHGPVTEALGEAMADGLVLDAVIPASVEQGARLWAMRDDQAEAQRVVGASIKHDVSVPVSKIPAFIARADAALERAYPGIVHYSFGHVGDGNIHYNPAQPPNWQPQRFLKDREQVNRIVHDIVADLDGSISAEHGIGQLRLSEAERYKQPVELEMMRAVKRALDPHNIMNPGKLIRL